MAKEAPLPTIEATAQQHERAQIRRAIDNLKGERDAAAEAENALLSLLRQRRIRQADDICQR